MSAAAEPGPAFCDHAIDRCEEMGVDLEDVRLTVAEYETRYASPAHYGPGRMVSTRGALAVVHTSEVVITVLWNRLAGRDAAA